VRVVAHLVRDEGVAGSNPATPTSFLVVPITYAASYAERNSPVMISRPVSRRSAALIAAASVDFRCRRFGGAARAPMRRLLPPAQMGRLLRGSGNRPAGWALKAARISPRDRHAGARRPPEDQGRMAACELALRDRPVSEPETAYFGAGGGSTKAAPIPARREARER
jgi:hypothetical protein